MTKTTETMEERFDEKFKLTSSDVEWFGDGHFCIHHGDDPGHGDLCYQHPILLDIKDFIRAENDLARQEGEKAGREKVVEGIKAEAEEAVHGLYYVRIELLEALTNPTT